MSKKSCPLGEDCDLTIAWMKGAEDARDRAKVRIEALEAKLAKAEDFVRRAIRYAGNNGDDFLAEKGREALLELRGENDE